MRVIHLLLPQPMQLPVEFHLGTGEIPLETVRLGVESLILRFLLEIVSFEYTTSRKKISYSIVVGISYCLASFLKEASFFKLTIILRWRFGHLVLELAIVNSVLSLFRLKSVHGFESANGVGRRREPSTLLRKNHNG